MVAKKGGQDGQNSFQDRKEFPKKGRKLQKNGSKRV